MSRYLGLRCKHCVQASLKNSLLIEEWSTCTAKKAYEKLSQGDVSIILAYSNAAPLISCVPHPHVLASRTPQVSVTNASDKEGQLPKILQFDDKVRSHGSGSSTCHPLCRTCAVSSLL